MKVKEVYARAKQLMFEKSSSTIYDNYVVGNLNAILMELFYENNLMRASKHIQMLQAPQQLPETAYSDIELEYEDEYVNTIIPIGLAARLLQDDDMSKASAMATEYNNRRVMTQKVVGRKTLDAYS